ncbi:hypothetical protein CS053_10085 [Rhodanobacter glycinis]|uniref:Restriction endonuclease type IV Mrr domain-containing protein n=1 Tax=Rhodanobacter glycinis TaxID=582702 RepID=A0A5B9E3H5_9GAMM|nr:hypothetical protein [Rhodanobacter glycinis]QEE24807.1 hypothetical protein CS053_10085 [Rhodanobacter glycinis]
MGTELYSYALARLGDEAFEKWLCVFMKDRHQLRVPPQRIGRRGQAQAGTDLHFIDNVGRSIGVQAKAYVKTKLRAPDIDVEVAKAHGFHPPLDELIICTLSDKDAKLQEHVRTAQLHGHPNRITLLALQDLCDEVGSYQEARKHLLQNAIDGPQLATLMAIFDESPQGRLSPGQTDSGIRADAQDARLKAIEDWIDGGDPARALAELESYTGSALDTDRRRIFLRAQLSLGNASLVIDAGRAEILLTSPDPWVLAYAAHAAAAQGDRDSADRWLDRAMAVSDEAAKPTIISARVRVVAEYGAAPFASLVDLATAAIGDPVKVAFALADAAFQLGDLTAATFWYDKARNRQAHWPVGLQGNALGVQVLLLTERMFDENANPAALRDVASELAALLARPSVRADGVRMPLLVNLGTAYRFLGDAVRAAAAWDEALALPETPESVWVQRCVLSTDDAVPLPTEDLVRRWSTSALGQLIFVCTCTARGDFGRSQGLLDAMPDAATLSAQDRAALLVERIRLETHGDDATITPAHIDTALTLAHDDGPTIPLFTWLIFNFKQASPTQSEEVRSVLQSMAPDVPLDLERKIAMSEELLRLQVGEIALPWVPDMAAAAQDAEGRIVRIRAASVLLHLYALSYQWAAARALIDEVRRHHVDHPNLVWTAADALVQAGDRPGALALLGAAIQAGQRNCDLILSWARLALTLGQRRRANHVLRNLDVSPTSPHSYAKLFQARALLGVRDASTASPSAAEHVTPATAGKVLAAGLMRRPAKALAVAAGRVVQLRVLDGLTTRFDEQVLLARAQN